MLTERIDSIISKLEKVLAAEQPKQQHELLKRLESVKEKEKRLSLSEFKTKMTDTAKLFPLREDPGTVFRGRSGYNWTCPACKKSIGEGEMIVAFQPVPGARTTYMHLACDDWSTK